MKYVVINNGVYTVYDFLTTVSRDVEVDRRTLRSAIKDFGMWMGKGIIVVPAKHVKGRTNGI